MKTDKIDAATLARLHAGGFLPEVWVADDDTQRQRRQTAERMGVLEQMVRTKGRIHAILHANLIPKYSGHLFGKAGKKWLAGLPLPDEERAIVGRLVDELERNSDQLAKLDMRIIREALEDPRVVRLMTIPGIGPIVASTVLASIGDISRFATPEKLSCYFGLTPKVRQSGDRPARHGRISKQGNTHGRKMLVEAAWSAKTAPGPLRAFFERVQRNRGAPAAAVATARKLAVMIWHVLTEGTEYAYARPAFTAMKLRKAALKAGAPREYGKAGPGRDYWIKEIVPFYDAHEVKLCRVLTDRGTENCGNPEHHEYELYLALEDVDHSRTKTKSPQTNGIVERFHKTVLDEFYRVVFRKKIYGSIAELQGDLDDWVQSYNEERAHQGRWCFGKTPMQTFLDAIPLAKEKMIAA